MFNLDIETSTSITPGYLWTPFSEENDLLSSLEGDEMHIDREWKDWSLYLESDSVVIGLTTVSQRPINITFNRSEIALIFSRLKTDSDIEKFAKKYGLLGVAPPSRRSFELINGNCRFTDIIHTLTYGKSYFEPLVLWKWHILNIRRLLNLYKALVKYNSGSCCIDLEDKIINIKKINNDYEVYWQDGESTQIHISHSEARSPVKVGQIVLLNSIIKALEGAVNIYPQNIIDNPKRKIGFHISEVKQTRYLLAAIYYDLWQSINEDMQITICQNPSCRQPIKKSGRSRYCNDACKQAAYRSRKDK